MAEPDPSWDLYRTFLAVLREGSLSRAARALGLAQPTVGRHVDALEQALGFQLFTRSQTGLAPTDAAREMQPYAEALASTVAALRRTASGQAGAVEGVVRVSASEVVGAEVLPPILTSLRAQHPRLDIELVLSNRTDDLLRREADVAVRMVEPTQGALLVRRVGTAPLGFHARRDYLDRRGTPTSFEELREHDVIGFATETPALRRLLGGLPAFDTSTFSLRTDSDLAQLAAIRAGYGIGVCQVSIAAREPELVRLMADRFELPLPVHVAMHEDLRSTARCRAVFDALASGLKAHVRPHVGQQAGRPG